MRNPFLKKGKLWDTKQIFVIEYDRPPWTLHEGVLIFMIFEKAFWIQATSSEIPFVAPKKFLETFFWKKSYLPNKKMFVSWFYWFWVSQTSWHFFYEPQVTLTITHYSGIQLQSYPWKRDDVLSASNFLLFKPSKLAYGAVCCMQHKVPTPTLDT